MKLRKKKQTDERIAKVLLDVRAPNILRHLPTETQLEKALSKGDLNGFKQLTEGDLVYAQAAGYVKVESNEEVEYQFRTEEGDRFLKRKGIEIKYK